jgi:hypothetical protein
MPAHAHTHTFLLPVLFLLLTPLPPLSPIPSHSSLPCLPPSTGVQAAQAASAETGKAAVLKTVCLRLKKWGSLRPTALLALPTAAEQRSLVAALEKLCMEPSDVGSVVLPVGGNVLK